MGSDQSFTDFISGAVQFQSTLPGWGATTPRQETPAAPEISIHAPRMGSDSTVQSHSTSNTISIHAPRMGSDSTPVGLMYVHSISIHAPRMGSDGNGRPRTTTTTYFNPRSPDGERLAVTVIWPGSSLFQSTLPGWGATSSYRDLARFESISIHAPRMGSD